KSSVTDFLLRLWVYHQREVSLCNLRHLRKGSPTPGGSTLMTSAPNCASSAQAYGPAIKEPSSSTFTPANGMSALEDLSCMFSLVFNPIIIAPTDRHVKSAAVPPIRRPARRETRRHSQTQKIPTSPRLWGFLAF